MYIGGAMMVTGPVKLRGSVPSRLAVVRET